MASKRARFIERKRKRKEEAEVRQATYDGLSVQAKLNQLGLRRGESKLERARLENHGLHAMVKES